MFSLKLWLKTDTSEFKSAVRICTPKHSPVLPASSPVTHQSPSPFWQITPFRGNGGGGGVPMNFSFYFPPMSGLSLCLHLLHLQAQVEQLSASLCFCLSGLTSNADSPSHLVPLSHHPPPPPFCFLPASPSCLSPHHIVSSSLPHHLLCSFTPLCTSPLNPPLPDLRDLPQGPHSVVMVTTRPSYTTVFALSNNIFIYLKQ